MKQPQKPQNTQKALLSKQQEIVPGSDPLTLYAMAEAEFYMRLAPVWVTFEGSGGQYDSFTLDQQGGTTITGTRIQ